MPKDLPSPELLRKLLRYEPETGKLFWRKRDFEYFKTLRSAKCWNTKYAGAQAFTNKCNGYLQGGIFRKKHSAHRVIWALFYGKWPEKFIDHVNGDKTDNRIVNLRECTPSQNGWNSGIRSSNRSGYKGVWWNKRVKRWVASIRDGHSQIYLGSYLCPKEAHAAYCQAAQKMHGQFSNFGNTK
jgi:hypothetical protein